MIIYSNSIIICLNGNLPATFRENRFSNKILTAKYCISIVSNRGELSDIDQLSNFSREDIDYTFH